MKLNKIVFILLIISKSVLVADNTGVINGKIVDAVNDELLVGVNILIENIMLGASTDIDGNYQIIKIPPGIYNLNIYYIGYTNILVKDIPISPDSTTIVNAKLEEQILEVDFDWHGCGIPIVRNDESKKEYRIEADELFSFPINSSLSLATKSLPGLSFDIYQLGIKMRGSNIFNNHTLIDGFPVYQYFGFYRQDWSNLCSVSEMKISPGGFESEFGNSNAGLLNIYQKSGRYLFEGDFLINYTSGMSENHLIVKNPDLNFGANISGQILKYLKYNISHFNQSASIPLERTDKQHKEHQSYLKLNIEPDQKSRIKIVGEYNSANSYMIFDSSSIRPIIFFNPNKLWQMSEYQNKNLLVLQPYDQYMYRIGLQADYIFSHQSFSTFSIQKQYTNINNSTKALGISSHSQNNGNNCNSGVESWSSKFSFVSQINQNNMIKTGVEYVHDYFKLKNKHLETFFNKYNFRTSLLSLYLQDKIKTDGFIINIGLRFNYFSPKINLSDFKINESWKISPRIGFIYPINVEGKLFFNYGVYYQKPDFLRLAWHNSFITNNSTSSSIKDNDVDFENTTHSEIGFEQGFKNYWLAFSSIYYKEICNNQIHIVNNYSLNLYRRNVKGIEIGLKKIYGNNIFGSVYYDYIMLEDKFSIIENLDSDKRTNSSISFHLILRSTEKWGFKIFDFYPLSNFKINLHNQWHITTKSILNQYNKNYNIFNLNILKEINYYRYKVILFTKIQNLFNHQFTVKTQNILFNIYPRYLNFGVRFHF